MDWLEASGVNSLQIECWNGPSRDRWAIPADNQTLFLRTLVSTAMEPGEVHGYGNGSPIIDVPPCGSPA